MCRKWFLTCPLKVVKPNVNIGCWCRLFVLLFLCGVVACVLGFFVVVCLLVFMFIFVSVCVCMCVCGCFYVLYFYGYFVWLFLVGS